MTTADFERLHHRFVRYHTALSKPLAPRDYIHRLFELHRQAKAQGCPHRLAGGEKPGFSQLVRQPVQHMPIPVAPEADVVQVAVGETLVATSNFRRLRACTTRPVGRPPNHVRRLNASFDRVPLSGVAFGVGLLARRHYAGLISGPRLAG